MSRNFMQFAKTNNSNSLSIQSKEGDPDCFGQLWDPDDEACRDRCTVYERCGKEILRLNQVRERQARNSSSSSHSYSKVSTYDSRTQGSGIVRPKTPEGYPPGTEYLPPEEAGQNGPFKRGTAIAVAEGTAAGMKQFFSSLANFAGDTTAWHPNAGRWKYGDKYGKKHPKEAPPLQKKSPKKEPKS